MDPEPFGLPGPAPSKNTSFIVLLLPVVFLAGLGLGYLLWGKTTADTPASASISPQATSTASGQTKRYVIPTDGSPAIGPANAPITIVEFSDYQCPYCRKWHEEVFHRLLQDYQDKVRFVYRDFPLSGLHPEAEGAAEAAYCAGDQGNYWQYHDLLFSGQAELGTAGFDQYAKSLNLDLPKFDACMSTHRYQATVQANYNFAANLGIQSTPTFFINGLAIVGAQSYDVFKQVIDMELAGKIPK